MYLVFFYAFNQAAAGMSRGQQRYRRQRLCAEDRHRGGLSRLVSGDLACLQRATYILYICIASVRLAVNPTTNQKVAVKVIKKKSQSIAAVQKEVAIHIQAGVHHNVVRLLSTDEDDTNIFLIMELAAGGELFDRIGDFFVYNT